MLYGQRFIAACGKRDIGYLQDRRSQVDKNQRPAYFSALPLFLLESLRSLVTGRWMPKNVFGGLRIHAASNMDIG
jgi:hypothetical protein